MKNVLNLLNSARVLNLHPPQRANIEVLFFDIFCLILNLQGCKTQDSNNLTENNSCTLDNDLQTPL